MNGDINEEVSTDSLVKTFSIQDVVACRTSGINKLQGF